MGEIADMMLDGTLCEGCGDYIGTDNGFPSYCFSCSQDIKAIEKSKNLLLNIENFNKFLHKNRLTIIKDFAPNGSRLIKAVDAFLLNAQARGLK